MTKKRRTIWDFNRKEKRQACKARRKPGYGDENIYRYPCLPGMQTWGEKTDSGKKEKPTWLRGFLLFRMYWEGKFISSRTFLGGVFH